MTIRVPSGLNAALDTQPVCPLSSSTGVPVRASQTFAVWSPLPVTIRVPSGLNAALLTLARVSLEFEQGRPRPRIPNHGLSGAVHQHSEPVTIRVPSGLNATLHTEPVCPFSRAEPSPSARPRPSPSPSYHR